MGFVSDHHLYVSYQSPSLRVRIELHGIANDIKIRALDRGTRF
jgi:hypothetical protein